MNIGISQSPFLGQTQQLAITQTMLQSLRILCMPVAELSQHLQECICENPLLDMEALAETEALPEPRAWESTGGEESSGESHFRLDYHDIWRGSGQNIPEPTAAEGTFTDLLLEQVNTVHLNETFRLQCHYIIGCLNKRGWLDIPLETLAEETGWDLFEMTQALYYIQSLQPTGVGARNLQECLLLQLAQGGDFNAHTIKLVTEGLPLLARGKLGMLQKLLQCGKHEAEQAVRIVRKLNPIPSQGFNTGEVYSALIPDVVLTYGEEGMLLTLNKRYLPKLRASKEYVNLALEDEAAKAYLLQKAKDAKSLRSAVEEREKTLAAVMRVIAQKQAGFFQKGETLLPMTQAEIAQELELHTSTVSRAVQGKYLKGPFGTIEIKKLFSGTVKTTAGGVVSSSMAKRKLQELVQGEDAHRPLSDETLRAVLAAMNITIARRTVAKYREELGIPPASQRRR